MELIEHNKLFTSCTWFCFIVCIFFTTMKVFTFLDDNHTITKTIACCCFFYNYVTIPYFTIADLHAMHFVIINVVYEKNKSSCF